jgi:hypothetical protein
MGAVLSAVGIYFVVGRGASVGGATVTGDLLILVSRLLGRLRSVATADVAALAARLA